MKYEVKKLTPFRLLSIYAYDAIRKGHNMFALVELDVTDIRQSLRSQRKEGHKASLFGFLLSAIAKAIDDNKELNHIRCGEKIYYFDDVDIDAAIELKHNWISIPRKYLVRDADTEIRFISFGSEASGYRGSRRYVKRHLDELKQLDTRMLNIETVASPEIVILTSDVNGTVKNSPEMVKSVVRAAERAGVSFKVKPATLGTANDSGPFSQQGLKALTLLAFKITQQMVAFYHQKWDRPDILTIEPLLNVLKLTLEWLKNDTK